MIKAIRFAAVVLLAWAWIPCFSARAEETEESDGIRKVRIALQEKFKKLPEVKVNSGKDHVSFAKVDLSGSLTEVDGEKYYAFRFQSLDEEGDLVWAFRPGKGLVSWYIFTEKERMQGFSTFIDYILPQDVENVGKKGNVFVLQMLNHRNMKPGKGYIMWFKFKEGGEPQVTLSLNIVAKNSVSTYKELFPMMYPPAN